MKIVVIANPKSGRGKSQHRLEELQTLAAGARIDLTIRWTSAPGDAIRTGKLAPGSAGDLARRAAQEGVDLVVAAGGDGTIGEVANGLMGTATPLGILPLGTGNDLVRTLGIPTHPLANLEIWKDGMDVWIDTIQGPGGIYLNVAGCGFDAEVAHRINKGYKLFRGTAAYLVAVVVTLFRYRAQELVITTETESRTCKAMLCAVANARAYGGGMMIAPRADVQDGLMDVVIVGDVSKIEFLRAFPSVFKGTHLSHPKVETFRAQSVHIESKTAAPVLADGEEIGITPAEFKVLPKSLKVRLGKPIS